MVDGVIPPGPHDRYGARLVWIATFTALIAAARYFEDEPEALETPMEVPALQTVNSSQGRQIEKQH